ncbi:Uu.00g068390.m01.CDS01 [Anthostomella pinea]|uniref:Uu.00g068390.m01.CDS01 n=1 Tax=Anthostomella pinea TaxID=933095 RepID=A0AAI8VUC3_9PEZI|nr:Uu.00g068390.m01.CDS01 [Anthostomella pinea]
MQDHNHISSSSAVALPPEVKQEIFQHLDIDSVPALATTCRAFYRAYVNAKGLIHHSIATKVVGTTLLPLAVARYVASKANWRTLLSTSGDEKAVRVIQAFASVYLRWGNKSIPFGAAAFTFDMAKDMSCFPDTEHRPSTKSEMTTLHKAVYIMALAGDIFSVRAFWLSFPPWYGALVYRIEFCLDGHIESIWGRHPELHEHPDEVYYVSDGWFYEIGIRRTQLIIMKEDGGLESFFADLRRITAHHNLSDYVVDGMCYEWLKPVLGDRNKRSLSAQHLLEAYPETEDTGLRDCWYLILAGSVLEEDEVPGDRENCAWWIYDLQGICWDRARLEEFLHGSIPTMEEMVALVGDRVCRLI